MTAVQAYFRSRQDAAEAAEALGQPFTFAKPEETGRRAHRRWVLVIGVPESMSLDGSPTREAMARIERVVRPHDGEVSVGRSGGTAGSISRLATPLPRSVIERYRRDHPEERHGSLEDVHDDPDQPSLFEATPHTVQPRSRRTRSRPSPQKPARIIARQGADTFLVDLGFEVRGMAQGCILRDGVAYGPRSIISILARGYWSVVDAAESDSLMERTDIDDLAATCEPDHGSRVGGIDGRAAGRTVVSREGGAP